MTAKQNNGIYAPDGSLYITLTDGAGNLVDASSSVPTGAAGGDLTGTYPNPSLVSPISTTVTFSNPLTAASFIPTSSTIATNGMYLGAANQINFSTNSSSRWAINSGGDFLSNNTAGPRLLNSAASSTAPTLVPHRGDTTTGIGAQASGNISIVVGGAENARFTSTGTILTGTTTNDNAASGKIGEIISSAIISGSAISLTNNTPVNLTSISLTAGDWEVEGQVCFSPGASTSITSIQGSVNTTSATIGPGGQLGIGFFSLKMAAQVPGAGIQAYNIGRTRISINATTTVYLVVNATFTVSTMSSFGKITARRVR